MEGDKEPGPCKTTVLWEGYSYTKAYSSGRKTSYRCSFYRSTKCKARVDVMVDGSYQNAVPHTCEKPQAAVPDQASAGEGRRTRVRDVVEDMKQAVDSLALADLTMVPNAIWDIVREDFTSKTMIRGLSKDQVVSRVYRTRNIHFGSAIYGRVEVPPLSMTKGGDANFFQFHYTFVDDGNVQHIIGWGHPALIRLLSYNQTAVYIDGTFHCVPTPFYQCIVIMVHDRGSKCFVPCMYVLTTNKSEWTYWSALHCVKVATGMNMDVSTMTCDFERGLINAVRDQFPDATIIGCLFHFKQAVRRKMQKLRIPVEEIKMMMKRGFLDSLTVLPRDRIDPYGFQYVIKKLRAALDEKGTEYSSDKWTQFWEYFRKTWIDMYPPKLWNIKGVTRTIVNRTNNPLERYNRELNVAFPNSRPNIPTFIGTIERHASRYVSLLEDIAHNRASAPVHETYVVPAEFNV